MPQQPQRNGVGSGVTAVCPLAALVGGRGVKAVLTLILKKPLNLRLRFELWKWGNLHLHRRSKSGWIHWTASRPQTSLQLCGTRGT